MPLWLSGPSTSCKLGHWRRDSLNDRGEERNGAGDSGDRSCFAATMSSFQSGIVWDARQHAMWRCADYERTSRSVPDTVSIQT